MKTLNKKFDLMIFASEELLNYLLRGTYAKKVYLYIYKRERHTKLEMQSLFAQQISASNAAACARRSSRDKNLTSKLNGRIGISESMQSSASSALKSSVKGRRRKQIRRKISIAHHGADYVATFEPENAAGGGVILAAAVLGRYLSTGKRLDVRTWSRLFHFQKSPKTLWKRNCPYSWVF